MKLSDDGADYFYFLVTQYAAHKNAHMFQDLKAIPEIELNAETEALEGLIKEILDVGEL